MCEKQPGARVPNVLRRCAPYKGKALAPHGGYSCYVGEASRDSRAPNPENSKAPDLEVESFFGVAPMRALWFYVTAVTAVTMFYTFSLAVTAVTVVTCIYEFMGDSLCTYVHERASWYVRSD